MQGNPLPIDQRDHTMARSKDQTERRRNDTVRKMFEGQVAIITGAARGTGAEHRPLLYRPQ